MGEGVGRPAQETVRRARRNLRLDEFPETRSEKRRRQDRGDDDGGFDGDARRQHVGLKAVEKGQDALADCLDALFDHRFFNRRFLRGGRCVLCRLRVLHGVFRKKERGPKVLTVSLSLATAAAAPP